MKIAFCFILSILFVWGYAQKPVVTLDTYKSWQQAVGGELSGDGKFAIYTVTNVPRGNRTVYVKSTTGKQLFAFAGMYSAKFTNNSKFAVGVVPGDTLNILDLGNGKRIKIPGIRNYKLWKWQQQERIFVNDNGHFSVLDFSGKVLRRAVDVIDYVVDVDGKVLVKCEKDTATNNVNVVWTGAKGTDSNIIFSGSDISNVILDESGSQTAFLGKENGRAYVCYFRAGMKSAKILNIPANFNIVAGRYWRFSHDGLRVFCAVAEYEHSKKNANANKLEIWNYQDSYLQSHLKDGDLAKNNGTAKFYLSTIELANARVTQLLGNDEELVDGTFIPETDDCFAFQKDSQQPSAKWPNGKGRSYYLYQVAAGKKILLEKNQQHPIDLWSVSPTGRFIVYYSVESKSYISYDIAEGKKENITSGIEKDLLRYDRLHYPNPQYYALGVAGWLEDDQAVLIKGTYDLWRADPRGKLSPINLTTGLGKREKVVFCPARKIDAPLPVDSKILLTAFDLRNKNQGFYMASVKPGPGLSKLSMARRYAADAYVSLNQSQFSDSKNGYLVRFEQSNHSGNFYFSKDLKSFSAVSEVAPELNCNWLTAELHTYQDSLGNELQGVLYKPENFDSTKVYPVLFSAYEFRSNQLNTFPLPELAAAEFNIPLMVSNGYLVFLPDVRSTPRFGGAAMVRSIVAAADHLSQYKWLDTARMGISGHSVGGFVINYTVTHCNRFKVALSGAGISDMMRAATDLWGNGMSKQEFLKDAVYMMETNLADDPQTYVRNSPILSAKNLTTPLMLVHNDQDFAVSYLQSRSFFIVLRNLHKPCWWLNYEGQGHLVFGADNQMDFNTKVIMFFDHYLKDTPTPAWMKEHI